MQATKIQAVANLINSKNRLRSSCSRTMARTLLHCVKSLMARSCRAGGADQCPKSGVKRTQRGHAAIAESDPNLEAFTRLAYRPLVTDWAMEAWYHLSMAWMAPN